MSKFKEILKIFKKNLKNFEKTVDKRFKVCYINNAQHVITHIAILQKRLYNMAYAT